MRHSRCPCGARLRDPAGIKSDPAKKNVAGSVVVRTSHNRRWCVLRRRARHPAVALSHSCHLYTPPRSIPRGARGLAASCAASRPVPAATASSGNRGLISPHSLFSRAKATSGDRTDAFRRLTRPPLATSRTCRRLAMPIGHRGSPAKAVGALVRGSRAGASLPAALHAGDAAHEKASAKATEYGLSKPEFPHNSSDVGSGDDQDDANGGDDESKRCVNELSSRIARDPSREHVATRVARGTRRAGRPHMRGARDIFPDASALTVHPRSARAKSDPTRVGLNPARGTRKALVSLFFF